MMSGKLVEELEAINKRAFEMALSVHKDPASRTQLSQEASLLEKRLLHIAGELEQGDAAMHKQWFHRISESLLELMFVEAETPTVSLRMGDIIRWG